MSTTVATLRGVSLAVTSIASVVFSRIMELPAGLAHAQDAGINVHLNRLHCAFHLYAGIGAKTALALAGRWRVASTVIAEAGE